MYCFKCGKEIADNSEFCSHCGAKLGANKQASYTKFIVVALIVAGVGFGGHQWYVNYKINNPVLNSPSDINDELIQKIITNSIDSLTIMSLQGVVMRMKRMKIGKKQGWHLILFGLQINSKN